MKGHQKMKSKVCAATEYVYFFTVLSSCSLLSTRVRRKVLHEDTRDFGQEQRAKKLQQSLRDTEYRFTVKLRGSYAGIHSCSLRCASGDTNCPSGRTNPDLFYGNKRDQIKMFPLSEQSTQICPRGPAAPAALSLVYVPVRLRRLLEAPQANRRPK